MPSSIERERAYYDDLYSGFAQQHFAKPAVVAFRQNLVARIVRAARLGPSSRVLSLGCGIGDTEILIAPFVSEIIGVDLSPEGIRHAKAESARQGVKNARFVEGE